MKNKIRRHKDINENTIYSWECPNCGHYNDDFENPNIKDLLCCEGCLSEVKVID